MKFMSYLNERDIAKLPVEKCNSFKGMDLTKCKIKQYEEYLEQIRDALKTSESKDETDKLKASEKWATGVLKKLVNKTR